MSQIEPVIRPTYKQAQAYKRLWDEETRFLLFGGGAEGGKSWLGAEWLLTNCYKYPDTKWFIGRNELKRLMASSYATFRKLCTYHKIPPEDWKLNGQYNYIEFKNKSRIDLLDLKYNPSDPMFQRFGSTEYTGGWIEEAGEVHFLAFDVLKSRIGRWNNDIHNLFPKLLLTCNPEQNWLYRIFYKPWKNNRLEPGYAFIQSLYKDNPYTAVLAEQRLDQIKDPTLRSRLKMGDWEYASGDNSLVDFDSIVDLFSNTIEESDQRYFTGDVARHGSDKTTLACWRGFNLYNLEWKVDRGIDQTAEDVRETLRIQQIPYSHAVCDDDGVGGGVVDNVRGIKGFTGNASPLVIKHTKDIIQEERIEDRKENYKNLRSQCGFMLAQAIVDHRIAISAFVDEITKEQIIEDLQALLRKKETPTETKLQLIAKDEVKEIIGRSPDFADTMLMRMYFELDKPRKLHITEQSGGVAPYYQDIDGGLKQQDLLLPKPAKQGGGIPWDY